MIATYGAVCLRRQSGTMLAAAGADVIDTGDAFGVIPSEPSSSDGEVRASVPTGVRTGDDACWISLIAGAAD